MKQIEHFVPKKSEFGVGAFGYPACHCYKNVVGLLPAVGDEVSLTRKSVTCKNCRKTRVFRKLK